jgi:hypothetical protein
VRFAATEETTGSVYGAPGAETFDPESANAAALPTSSDIIIISPNADAISRFLFFIVFSSLSLGNRPLDERIPNVHQI